MNCDRCRDTGWVRNPEGVWQPFINDAIPCPDCNTLHRKNILERAASKLAAAAHEGGWDKEADELSTEILALVSMLTTPDDSKDNRLLWAEYIVLLIGRMEWDRAAQAVRHYRSLTPPPTMSPERIEKAAEAAFLAHWPNDRWERFGNQDYVKDQYRAIAKAVLEAANAAP